MGETDKTREYERKKEEIQKKEREKLFSKTVHPSHSVWSGEEEQI